MLETEYRVPGCNAMTAAILKIVFLCISQRFIVRSTPNLVWRSRITFRHRSQTKIPNFEKSKWRTAAMLKMVLSSYLSRESSDFNETWWMDTNFDSKNGHVTKYQKFPNSERRTAAMLKAVLWIVSTIYCPINAKFCKKKHNHAQTQVMWPQYQISKIQDGGRSPISKWFYHYISAGNHPTSMKFGARRQILVLGDVTKCQNAKFRKFKK